MSAIEYADDAPADTGVLDLRGGAASNPHTAGVLEDPSGRRRARVRWLGRAAGAGLCLWLAALALAGVGLIPRGVVPLGRALTAPDAAPAAGGDRPVSIGGQRGARAQGRDASSPAPPPAKHVRTPTARHERAAPDRTAPGRRVRARVRAGLNRPRGNRVTSPGKRAQPVPSPAQTGAAPGAPSSPGQPGSAPRRTAAPAPTAAPGQTTAPGKTTAPGQTTAPVQTTAPGQTGSAQGQTTAPGQSGAAPGSEAESRTGTVPAGSGRGGEHSPVLGADGS